MDRGLTPDQSVSDAVMTHLNLGNKSRQPRALLLHRILCFSGSLFLKLLLSCGRSIYADREQQNLGSYSQCALKIKYSSVTGTSSEKGRTECSREETAYLCSAFIQLSSLTPYQVTANALGSGVRTLPKPQPKSASGGCEYGKLLRKGPGGLWAGVPVQFWKDISVL